MAKIPGSPLWISHRGYKAEAVENTIEAFQAAVQQGFVALETDLRLSRDGHIVLSHDPDLSRLAGIPRRVETMTRDELAAVELKGGSHLLFLDAFIQAFPGYNWTFDIKPETGLATIKALHDFARKLSLYDWLVEQARFVIWSVSQEQELLRLFPKAEVYAQERECWRAGLGVVLRVPALGGIRVGRTYSLPPKLGPMSLYTPAIVGAFHTRGARVVAFLPETAEQARQAVDAGADEILTNGPMDQS